MTTKIKSIVKNLGAPKTGSNVAWAKGLKSQKLIRVHVQAAEGLTLCRALNTQTSPYLGTAGHVAFRTNAKVTCQPCMGKSPKKAKTQKAASEKASASKPKAAKVKAPVVSPTYDTPTAPKLIMPEEKNLPVPASEVA